MDLGPPAPQRVAPRATALRTTPALAEQVRLEQLNQLVAAGWGPDGAVRIETRDEADGELLFVNRSSVFLGGQGGVGGRVGPGHPYSPAQARTDWIRWFAVTRRGSGPGCRRSPLEAYRQ